MQIDTRNIYQADVTTNILHKITNSQESIHTTYTYNIHFWRIYLKEQILPKYHTHINEIKKFEVLYRVSPKKCRLVEKRP